MEADDSRTDTGARDAESSTMAVLRRAMLASSMGLATVALVAMNTSTGLGGSSDRTLAAPASFDATGPVDVTPAEPSPPASR